MLPFWGEPEYLYAAVDSILAQDSDAWRLVVVDDHYPDTSVADYFAELDDDRVQYLRNEVNLGITDNYRKCLSLVEADYMMFMGCDDLMHPGYVRTVLAATEQFKHVEIIQPGVDVIDDASQVYQPLADKVKRILTPKSEHGVVVSGEQVAVSILQGDWLYWPSLVFRTEAIREVEFLEGFPLIQDVGMLLDLVANGGRIAVLPEVVFSYRRHHASASSAKLMDGGRFAHERAFFALQAQKMAAIGWRKAARAAKLHITSRAYALTLLPKAIQTKKLSSVRTLLLHATARSKKTGKE